MTGPGHPPPLPGIGPGPRSDPPVSGSTTEAWFTGLIAEPVVASTTGPADPASDADSGWRAVPSVETGDGQPPASSNDALTHAAVPPLRSGATEATGPAVVIRQAGAGEVPLLLVEPIESESMPKELEPPDRRKLFIRLSVICVAVALLAPLLIFLRVWLFSG